jgi:soluble lytic murein transglycosylase-like protein
MNEVSHTLHGAHRALRLICVAVGLALMLRTSGLSDLALSPPPSTSAQESACPMPERAFAAEISAVSRDIGRRFHLAQSAAVSITAAAFSAAQARGIDPTLVLAVAAVESKFRAHALNASTGAAGLMQVVPKWHQDKVVHVGGESSLLLVAPNIRVGAAIIAEYLSAENGNVTDALARYLGTAGADRYVNRVRLEMAHLTRVLESI